MKQSIRRIIAAVLTLAMVFSSAYVGVPVRAASAEGNIDLTRAVAAEGMILLENRVIDSETGTKSLPVPEGTTVAMFGRAMIDYVRGGGGSGATNVQYSRNILQGMQVWEAEGKVHLVPELTSFYTQQVTNNGVTNDANITIPDDVWNAAAAATETAVVTIGRTSSEGSDRSASKGDYYLSDAEHALITRVAAEFENTIVVLNVGGVVDTSWVKGPDAIPGVDAVLNGWQGGMEGGLATADILLGYVNPSGKTVDTWAKDYQDYPSSSNFKESNSYVNYTEDIFVGYRYFETIPGAAEKVNYEFGYGLSYTDFTTVTDSVEAVGDEIVVKATVTNVGSVAGKQVVQVYFTAPRGKLTKPAKELAAFGKTGLLAPGASETLELRFAIADLSSYDDEGAIQRSAYVMEKGDYRFFVGNSVRDGSYADYVYTVAEDTVTEQLTERCIPLQLPERLLEDGTYVPLNRSEQFDPHHVITDGVTKVEMEAFIASSGDVTIESCTDDQFNRIYCLAYMQQAGRWAEYSITATAEQAGRYAVLMRYANGNAPTDDCFKVTVDGEPQVGVVFNAAQTGDGSGAAEWYNFRMAEEPFYINLHEGENRVRFTANRNNPNYDYMLLERVGDVVTDYETKVLPEGVNRIEAEKFDTSGRRPGSTANAPAIENFGNGEGCIAFMNAAYGNYVSYCLYVQEAGTYDLTLVAANGRASFDFQPGIRINDDAYPCFLSCPQTGDGDGAKEWYNFEPLAPVTVQLPQGNCILTLEASVAAYPNIDYFTLVKTGAPASRAIPLGTDATVFEAENYHTFVKGAEQIPNRLETFATEAASGTCVAYMNYVGNQIGYYLNAPKAGTYNVYLKAANGRADFEFDPLLEVNGIRYSTTMTCPQTGDGSGKSEWFNFMDLEPISVQLNKGENYMTLGCAVRDAFPNLDTITLELVETPYATRISATEPTTIQAEAADRMGRTRGSNDPRTESFSGGVCMAYMNYAGNYLCYDIYVEEAGSYDITLYAANGRAGFDFQPGVQVDDEVYNTFVNCPQTGDGSGKSEWYNFVALAPVTVNLPKGNCTLKLQGMTGSYPNIDYFTLERKGEPVDRTIHVSGDEFVLEAESFQHMTIGETNGYPVCMEAFTVAGGGTCIAFMNHPGNQVFYDLDVAQGGKYTLSLKAANGYDGYDFDPKANVNGTDYPANITCIRTATDDNRWYNFLELDPITVELATGANVLSFTCETQDAFPNLDCIVLRKVSESESLATPAPVLAAETQADSPIMLLDVYNDRSLMPAFLDQLTVEELAQLLSAQGNRDAGNTQGWGNNMKYGIPLVMTADGPQGIRIGTTCTAWPISTCIASSWDVNMAAAVGHGAAVEAHQNNMDIWLAPGMNIHRDPLCGRNFEYYSEDPLIAGKMAASITRATQAEGVAISLKHFACNNKETNRSSSDSRLTERALREIYLRGFEIAVKEADPWTIMSSYNYINGTETAENYDLLTGILRGEWGYNGVVETDWGNNTNHVLEVLAGNDVKMTNSQPAQLVAAVEAGRLTREQLETGAQRVLELIMKVNYFHDRIVNVPVTTITPFTHFKAAENIAWSETVRAEATSDTDGGQNLGYCDAGGWAQYNIDVEQAGIYDLTARTASSSSAGAFDVKVDDVVIASFEAVVTGGWQNWTTLPAQSIHLDAGRHVMRIEFTKSGSNLNWLEFKLTKADAEIVHVTGVTLDQTEAELYEGKTLTLTAAVEPANADDPSVTWTSGNEAVATVSADGTVTAIAEGTAVITVTTTDGGYTASCTVTVKAIPTIDPALIERAEEAARAAEEARRLAEEAERAAEEARRAAEAAAAEAGEDRAAAEAAKAQAEAAAAAAAEARSKAEAAQSAAESAAAAAAASEHAAAESAAKAAEEAAAAAGSASAAAVDAAKAADAAAQAQAAQAAAEAAQAAAEEAKRAAEEAAAEAGEDRTAAEEARVKAEAAQAAAEEAKAKAEAARNAAEEAAKAAAASDSSAAAHAAEAAAEAAKAAGSAAGAASDAARAAQAQAAAQAAQAAAEAAEKAAREAQKKAEEAEKTAGSNAALSEQAAADAEAARAAAQAAQKAAESARTAAEAARKAAETANTEAAKAAADAAAYAQQAAKAQQEIAAVKAEMVELLAKAVAEAERAAAERAAAEEARKAAEAAALASAKNLAAFELAQRAANETNVHKLAAIEAGTAAVAAAKTPEEVAAALEAAMQAADDAQCPGEHLGDVAPRAWYHDSVDYMVDHGYMEGTSETDFDPNGSVTRAQLVTILWRIAGKPTAEKTVHFVDVPAGKWYTEAVNWAADQGVVNGVTATEFKPMARVTRAQIAAILFRYTEGAAAEGSLDAFADASQVCEYAVDAMTWAVSQGLITGKQGADGQLLLDPCTHATRAQIAAIMMRYLEPAEK